MDRRGSLTLPLPPWGGLARGCRVDDVTIQPQGGRRLRVLIVDDNRDAADSLAMLLTLWGHDCRVAYDGPSGLEVARDYRPDCLLLDIGMPGMDGCTVAQRVRADPELAGIQLIALTAWADPDSSRRIREAGFDRHLIKPAPLTELQGILALMDRTLRLTREGEELARRNAALLDETRDSLRQVKDELRQAHDELRELRPPPETDPPPGPTGP
jgi:CheY-like chemotaxis protein